MEPTLEDRPYRRGAAYEALGLLRVLRQDGHLNHLTPGYLVIVDDILEMADKKGPPAT